MLHMACWKEWYSLTITFETISMVTMFARTFLIHRSEKEIKHFIIESSITFLFSCFCLIAIILTNRKFKITFQPKQRITFTADIEMLSPLYNTMKNSSKKKYESLIIPVTVCIHMAGCRQAALTCAILSTTVLQETASWLSDKKELYT